jgi:predicted DNA-binding transcriptional regulator AlpA
MTEKLAEKTYLTSLETVAYLGLPSVNALKQRMKRRTIPAWCWTRMGGKSLRFVRASLDEWLQPEARKSLTRRRNRK